jgi:hypothetical protein
MNAHFLLPEARVRVQAAAALTLVIALMGCTNIKNDSQRTQAEGADAGAATGAALGADAGALTQKKEGALAGAAVGGLAGDAVAGKKEGSAKQESALDSQLAGLNRQIEGRRAYNAKLREVVNAKEQQLATVLAADRSAGPTVQEFDLRTSVNSKVGEIDRAARSWQETIDAHKKVVAGASSDPRGPELEAEINRLAEERAELLRQRERLISISQKLAK